MKIPTSIFKSYDIRGTYPDQINIDNIYQITQSVLAVIQDKVGKKNVTLSIGHDMRLSAPILYPIFKKALIDGGAHIIDNDLVSTPTFYFSILHLKTDGGIQLTASHNPANYTGMKMATREGDKLMKMGVGSGMEEIINNAQNSISLNNKGGNESKHGNIVAEEIQHAFDFISPDGIKPLKVVADPANAMASLYISELFKHLPCELIKMNFNLDGSFPAHQPNPSILENLVELQERVVDEKADLGLAPDGDGDRMIFIDEKGQMVQGSFITALLSKKILQMFPGETIIYDIRTVMTQRQIIKEYGGKSDMTRVGHAHITKNMHKTGAIFGGETSAHYFFRHTGGAESQIPIILLVLKIISEENKTLSQLISDIKRSYESGEVNFITEKAPLIMEKLKSKYTDAKISILDGVSIEYDDWRCNVRSSNTESLLRLNVEAVTEDKMKSHFQELVEFIKSFGAKQYDH